MSVAGQSHLEGSSQVVGTSINVGMRIFSIVGGLGFVSGQFRGCEPWLLVVRAQRLLRRLRMPRGVLERLRSLWNLVEGFREKGQ